MNFITKISRVSGIFGACLLALTGFMLTYEVIARYFFVKPTTWAAELSQLCLIWGCLLAMSWCLSERHHITVNAVTVLLPRRVQKICVALSLVAIIIFSAIVTIWGWEIFYESWERGRTTGSILDLPSWIAELSVPVGFFLLISQALVELISLRSNDVITLGDSHE